MALIFPDGSYTTNELPAGGITTLPGANTTVANPNYADLVAKQYATLGRTGIGEGQNQIDQEGFNYWTNQLASGALTPDQFQSSFKNAAENVYINQAYQDLFGRSAEPEGLQYWTGALDTTNKEDIYNAIKSGARGQDLAKAYGVTDTDISGEIAAGDIKQYLTENINDPYAIYSAAEKYKVDPTTIAAVAGWSPEDTAGFLNKYNLAKTVEQEYKDIGRGLAGDEAIDKEGFNYWYNQLQSGNITPEQFEKTFLTAALDVVGKGGAGEDVAAKTYVEALAKGYGGLDVTGNVNPLEVYEEFRSRGLTPEDIVAKNPQMTTQQITDYFSNVGDLYGQNVDTTITDILGKDYAAAISPDQKQTLVNNLLTGKSTREDLTKMFQESGANKNQEATRIANSYVAMYGGSKDDADALYAKLMGTKYSGPGKVDPQFETLAKDAFNKSLKTDSGGIYDLIKDAANKEGAEKQQFFINNPEQLAINKDIGKTVKFDNAGTGGQYGYYKGIPILKASEVDEVFDKMGTDYIQGNAPDKLDNDMGWDTGSLSALESRGAAAFGIKKQEPEVDPFTGEKGKATYTGDMNAVAKTFKLDPANYKSQDELYDAINEKAKDFYYIAGKTGSGKTNDKGETSAFTRDDVSGNHAAVLYQKVGDKLIPIPETLKYYNGEMELKKGSWFSDTFGGIASIPLIAEIVAIAQPELYPLIKAAQTAALGGGLNDMIKSGGLAYLSTAGAKAVSPFISETLGTSPLATNLATGATIGAAGAGITGQDIGKGALTGLTGAGLAYGTNQLLPEQGIKIASDLGIDPKYQSLFANTLARLGPTILTGGKIDPTKLLMSYAMNKAMKEGKEQMRTA